MAKHFSKSTEARNEQMSRFLSVPDAPYITASRQAAKTKMLSVVRIQQKEYLVFMHSYFETLGKYLLFTKYQTSTNMPTAQQKKGTK